jgi:hypothetical protein
MATLCESGGTLDLVVRLEDAFVPPIVPHLVYEVNCTTEVSKVRPKSWHAPMAKLHDLPMWPTIDRAGVIHGVVFLHYEEGVFQLMRAW